MHFTLPASSGRTGSYPLVWNSINMYIILVSQLKRRKSEHPQTKKSSLKLMFLMLDVAIKHVRLREEFTRDGMEDHERGYGIFRAAGLVPILVLDLVSPPL